MTIGECSIKLQTLESFTVIGMSIITSKAEERKSNKIGKLFAAFANRSDEIGSRINDDWIGVSVYPESFTGFEKYEYIAGYRVTDAQEIPEGMKMRNFPSCLYAVMTHKGSLRRLADSYGYFHSKWLPESGYEYADSYDVQLYESRFLGGDHPESELDVYIPVRPAQNGVIHHPRSPIGGQIQGAFIPVKDVRAAKSWYSRILGLPETDSIVNGHLYVLPVNGINLILDEMPMWGGSSPDGPPAYRTPAFMLPTANIQEAYTFMKSQGTELVTDIMDEHWFAFRDPDGNLLMVCQTTEP